MKLLYIVRHAKSSWNFPNLSDHDRPLNKRGKRDAPRMGDRLKDRKIKPALIISSTAKRALITAKVIAEKIGYPEDRIVKDRRLYHAGVNGILEILHEQDPEVESVFIVGHNPGFTDAANELGTLSIENIPTCGLVCLEFDVGLWSEINLGAGKLQFFDYPKKPFP